MEKKKNQAVSPTLEELRQELHQTNQALRNAYDKFNFVTAPELVEASIYEINALKARSDYLLRCIKAQLGQEPCAAAAAMKGGTACPSSTSLPWAWGDCLCCWGCCAWPEAP